MKIDKLKYCVIDKAVIYFLLRLPNILKSLPLKMHDMGAIIPKMKRPPNTKTNNINIATAGATSKQITNIAKETCIIAALASFLSLYSFIIVSVFYYKINNFYDFCKGKI
jgi:hypothetical protein